MTEYQKIREARRILKLNGGLTADQLALVMRCKRRYAVEVLRVMGDAYIDRWIEIDGKNEPVYELADIPQSCPKPN